MSCYDLSDFEWRVIEPLLPNKSRGVPRVDDRRVLNGIFWVLRSGAPRRDLPERYGPRTTCYNRFVRWRKAGVWDCLMDAITVLPPATTSWPITSSPWSSLPQCVCGSALMSLRPKLLCADNRLAPRGSHSFYLASDDQLKVTMIFIGISIICYGGEPRPIPLST
jgi:hypothetical protein